MAITAVNYQDTSLHQDKELKHFVIVFDFGGVYQHQKVVENKLIPENWSHQKKTHPPSQRYSGYKNFNSRKAVLKKRDAGSER